MAMISGALLKNILSSSSCCFLLISAPKKLHNGEKVSTPKSSDFSLFLEESIKTPTGLSL